MAKQLMLGVARCDITPKIGCRLAGYDANTISKSIHDNLALSVFAFSYGKAKFILISADVLQITSKVSIKLREEIQKRFSVPYGNIIISAVHTHTAPNLDDNAGWGDFDFEYFDSVFEPSVYSAVGDALKKLTPVKMGMSVGKSYVGVNRRELTKKGTITFGQDPHAYFNPKMTVISFADLSGKCIGNLIHYGIHCTASGHSEIISRDLQGYMTDRIEKISGGLTAFINGPEGDVGPRLSNGKTVGSTDLKHTEEIGPLAASDAEKIFKKIKKYKDTDMQCLFGFARFPLMKRISLSAAEKGFEQFKDRFVNISGQKRNYYKSVIDSYHDKNFHEKSSIKIEQCILRLGGVVIVSTPFELFSQIGVNIETFSDFENVLVLSNSNGSEGYFPTESELCRGGYEVDMFLTKRVQRPKSDADWHFVLETLKNLEGLKCKE